jgi:hypothetical protein
MFAVRINKFLGQSLKIVGLDQQSPCLAFGKLYVGCLKKQFFILTSNKKISNILYNEVLWTLCHEFLIIRNRKYMQSFYLFLFRLI